MCADVWSILFHISSQLIRPRLQWSWIPQILYMLFSQTILLPQIVSQYQSDIGIKKHVINIKNEPNWFTVRRCTALLITSVIRQSDSWWILKVTGLPPQSPIATGTYKPSVYIQMRSSAHQCIRCLMMKRLNTCVHYQYLHVYGLTPA